MSDVVNSSDIQLALDNSVPANLPVLKSWLFDFVHGTLNNSELTPVLADLFKVYDQFDEPRSIIMPSLLAFDRKLLQFSHRNIRHLIASSLNGESAAFFSMFFSHFFNRFEIHYCDSQENLYEWVTQMVNTDDGLFTDENYFTDEGTGGEGVICLHAKVVFDITEHAHVYDVWEDTIKLLTILKPVKWFVFHVPVLDIRINTLVADDAQYVEELVTGDDPYFDNVSYTPPADKLATDVDPVWKTDGTPPILTDEMDTEYFLQTINVITVQYADNPGFDVNLSAVTKVTQYPDGSWYLQCQCELPKEIVYFKLGGGFDLISADVLKPIYIKPLNTDSNMRLRFTWTVPPQVGDL